jgi:hypothetical protein
LELLPSEEREQRERELAALPGGRPEELAAACGWNVTSGQRQLQLAANSSSNSSNGSSGGGSSGGRAIQQQHLFSVYIHAPPDITGAGSRAATTACCRVVLLNCGLPCWQCPCNA